MSAAPCSAFRARSERDATTCGACGWSEAAHGERCGWLDDASEECGARATRGTNVSGPLCDEHGEQHERESE